MAALGIPALSALENTTEATVQDLLLHIEKIRHLKVRSTLRLLGRNSTCLSVCGTNRGSCIWLLSRKIPKTNRLSRSIEKCESISKVETPGPPTARSGLQQSTFFEIRSFFKHQQVVGPSSQAPAARCEHALGLSLTAQSGCQVISCLPVTGKKWIK